MCVCVGSKNSINLIIRPAPPAPNRHGPPALSRLYSIFRFIIVSIRSRSINHSFSREIVITTAVCIHKWRKKNRWGLWTDRIPPSNRVENCGGGGESEVAAGLNDANMLMLPSAADQEPSQNVFRRHLCVHKPFNCIHKTL